MVQLMQSIWCSDGGNHLHLGPRASQGRPQLSKQQHNSHTRSEGQEAMTPQLPENNAAAARDHKEHNT